jgi:ABC-2 type transport system ATP-binding protein
MLPGDSVAVHPVGMQLAVPNASAAIPGLLRRLDGDGVQITGLEMAQPSLDTVFMKYTGRHIREEAADRPVVAGV